MTDVLDPTFSRRFGRSPVRLAVPLGLGLAIAAWVLAARIGTPPTDPGVAVIAPGVSPSGGASTSPRSRPPASTPEPSLETFGAPLSGQVLVRGDGFRTVDLATGAVGRPIGPTDLANHVVLAATGKAWCLCAEWSKDGDDGAVLDLRLRRIDEDGDVEARFERVGRWVGRDDPSLAANQQGDSVWFTEVVSPDGRYVVIGVTVRQPPEWQRHVLVVDLTAMRVVQTLDLDAVPTPEKLAVHAWAPSFRFAPDGRHVLITAGVVERQELREQPSWIAPFGDGLLGDLRRIDVFALGPCRDSPPAFATAEIAYALCSGVLERVDIHGQRLPSLNLREAIGPNAWPAHLVDLPRGRLFLWDSFAWRGVAIDTVNGELLAAITVPGATADAGQGLAGFAQALGEWIAPPAIAKISAEPSIALSPDGHRLYLVGFHRGEGEDTDLIVLDAATLDWRAAWTVPGLIGSIATRADGTIVVVRLPIDEPADLRLLDAATGETRAIVQGLGEHWTTIADADWTP